MSNVIIDNEQQTILSVPVYVSGENVPETTPGRALVAGRAWTIDDLLERFSEWMRLDVADGRASASTLRSYWAAVRNHLQWLVGRGVALAQVDEMLLKEYRAALVERYKVTTVGRMLTSVRRFYEMAYAHGVIGQNPAARLKSPQDHTDAAERVKFISVSQLQRMMQLANDQGKRTVNGRVKGLRDAAMLNLFMRHGLRTIEMARLTLDDLDLQPGGEASTLRVLGKRDKWRTIHLVPQSQLALEKWLAARTLMGIDANIREVFVSLHWGEREGAEHGTGLSTRGIRKMIDGYLEAVGAKRAGISVHSLRHSFGTWAVYYGADLRAVSSEMGHSSIETTMVYSKVVDAMKSNPAKYLDIFDAGDTASD